MNTISLLLALFLMPGEAPKVYVCKSGTSYAYHKKLCQGLKRCTHRIDTVTIKEAVESGHEKACGYCYK
ncbi:hypothetical protein [uncultured Chitinophaga sp.]|uniref:hypothetical protein n=1 Tax=uncultured Chitinophaga sp. TaxID=339340 RepID=UPI0025D077EE|nr:hypothetical protein [uncultured Chitinophaga sp.]